MAYGRRTSESFTGFPSLRGESPQIVLDASAFDSEDWIQAWNGVYARDIIDSRIVSVDAETSVEEGCDILLSEDILCLAIKSAASDPPGPHLGLFDFSDVNAFLTLAATRHTLLPEDLRENHLINQIVTAARSGRVPIRLVSDLSEKNPLQVLPNDATIISLLEVFSRGTHRVLIQSSAPSEDYLGMVSDRGLLSWFYTYSQETPSLQQYLSNSLNHLSLPSLNIYSSVVACKSSASVLDAMKLMSEEGVSSVAVIDDESGTLLSAVSVTDIGKIVVPSQSNQILSTPLLQFISLVKDPDGSTDGADKFPVYSVNPTSSLSYTIQKLLATNAHRLFVTLEVSGSVSPSHSSSPGNLSGIVSIVDILSLFARLANVPDIDPLRMQRHRRASSTSSHSSKSDRDLVRSRSSSRTSMRQSPRVTSTIPLAPGVDTFQWTGL